jgi:cytochrome c biogenesis protein CcdA
LTDVGYLAAFLGGVLALLSPCSALVLPSFFAYAFSSRGRLLAHTAVFYLGLDATLVPLGAGSAWAAALFNGHRQLLILIAGWVIIALGVAQLLGGGFTVGPAASLQQHFARRGGWLAVFGLGATYGVAGFCSGPILGAVLTIAAAGGQALRGVVLLAVYALGMAVPMFILAALWQRLDLDRRRWIRGRSFILGPLHLHTTSAISGLLFIGIGVLFLLFNGTTTLGLLGLTPSVEHQLSAQNAVSGFSAHVPDIALLTLLAVLVLGIAAWRLRRHPNRHPSLRAPRPGPAAPDSPALDQADD